MMTPNALLVLDSLVEMRRILYSSEIARTTALLLGYYNQVWLHSIILKETIANKPKVLTRRTMFGVYFHKLSAHAGLMLRLISGQGANADSQERIFNQIKRITKTTSNYHARQIIPSCSSGFKLKTKWA